MGGGGITQAQPRASMKLDIITLLLSFIRTNVIQQLRFNKFSTIINFKISNVIAFRKKFDLLRRFFKIKKFKLSNNQINQMLVSQTTYTKPVGLEVAVHVAIAKVEEQLPALGIAVL